MKWKTAVCCALAALAPAAPAVAGTWQVDPAQSTLTFSNSYQGVQYTGRFKRFRAAIAYDPADLAHAKFDVSVDVGSLDTQNSERDEAALGEAFFDAAKFPEAYFVTTTFRKTPDGKVVALGELKLRGVVKPVELAVAFVPHGDRATLDVTAHLRRLDFGIGSGEWADTSMIANEVVVHGHLVLRAVAAARSP